MHTQSVDEMTVCRLGLVTLLTVLYVATSSVLGEDEFEAHPAPEALSPFMNSIPPSKDFFCVGNGPENRMLHPDRAPHSQLARQDGVILFSGAAPQQGLNFTLNAGALVYRNQMSTLGSSEPSPQVGTAGTLAQGPSDFSLPWTEARWHPGEDISWHGYRASPNWLGGQPYWALEFGPSPDYGVICPNEAETNVHKPTIYNPSAEVGFQGWGLRSSFNLQLSRGLYQASKIRANLDGTLTGECPSAFREPWLHARGLDPVFNVSLDLNGSNVRIGKDYFPNYHNIYTYQKLELDGGRLLVDFERSATWPRQATIPNGEWDEDGAVSGASVASAVGDEYGNRVVFDRVPKYGWHTDFKVPPNGVLHAPFISEQNQGDSSFGHLPEAYHPTPNAWRLPHKRLRTVRLFSADADETDPAAAEWTIAFVFEHPESDCISREDVPPNGNDAWRQWRSIYSHLPQSDWEFGRLPELMDETTLLTVQAYKKGVDDEVALINGAPFQDDYSVWGSTIGEGDEATRYPPIDLLGTSPARPNMTFRQSLAIEPMVDYVDSDGPGDTTPPETPDGCPGIQGVDDDGDWLTDEDTNNQLPYLAGINSPAACTACQDVIRSGYDSASDCWAPGNSRYSAMPYSIGIFGATPGNYTECKNPLYWRPDSNGDPSDTPMDPFAHWDDDEDGLIDEDGEDNPLLVHLRAIPYDDTDPNSSDCASGRHPFVPATSGDHAAIMPGGDTALDCRPAGEAATLADPWTYQVQYVYARNNPIWLLLEHAPPDDGTPPDYYYNFTPKALNAPKYYYFTPFSADINGDGVDSLFYDADGDGTYDEADGDAWESSLCGGTGIDCTVMDSSTDPAAALNKPNVHSDCVPDPNFRGPQDREKPWMDGFTSDSPPAAPSGVNLIKRIVRVRPDQDAPDNYIEQVWLYRYNDFGFLKAVFDPQAVQAIIDADPTISEPDDILRLADTAAVGPDGDELPLIMYASQWYTYYNPYTLRDAGIEPCYDDAPYIGRCWDYPTLGMPDSPLNYLPANVCDGEGLWQDAYSPEIHTDPDCSPFVRQDCGWCFARYACGGEGCKAACSCPENAGTYDPTELERMGIPDAVPRLRKHMIKTARMRGGDGEMHLYRFDYLGAASGVYADANRITSFADPHNITIVDEILPQTSEEFYGDSDDRSDFPIYEDDFRLVLDAAPAEDRPASFGGVSGLSLTSHYFRMPAKVKTRRVVVMNYYGIALSDRLILTPGYDGDRTSLVDDQRYELVNERGQAKHIYDESWVAALRHNGIEAVKDTGRVVTHLFGGEGGWHSVLRGIAKGSKGGNLYNQQCKTPSVLESVPVQRVMPEQLTIVGLTQHYERQPDTSDPTVVLDLPLVEASYYEWPELDSDDYADLVNDPAGTVGTGQCWIGDEALCVDPSEFGHKPGCFCPEGYPCMDFLRYVDLQNQEPVTLLSLPEDGAILVNYDYTFHGEDDNKQDVVKWKWRWEEVVDRENGGTDNVALEMWYFDTSGRLRLYGRGSGVAPTVSAPVDPPLIGGGSPIAGKVVLPATTTASHPTPTAPFFLTYYGFDDLGRPNIEINDFDLDALATLDSEVSENATCADVGFARHGDAGAPDAVNLASVRQFDDVGLLSSQTAGIPMSGAFTDDPSLWTPDDWAQSIRTDHKILANRTLRHTSGSVTSLEWQDPYVYEITYEGVEEKSVGEGSEDHVHGTTTVNVMDKSGKFIEQRIIAWNDARSDTTDKIEDFGWGISLLDYGYDGAIDAWGELSSGDGIPGDNWLNCGVNNCNQYIYGLGAGGWTPSIPMEGAAIQWPPATGDQLVTLARSFRDYRQASTLKPTHDIVFNEFKKNPSDPDVDARRTVVREYAYDLEDRIARQKEPDGTITRLLFDSKRRPTKIFKGSADGCSDWFPRVFSGSNDDMVLSEQRLYNDGDPDYESNDELVSGNDDFPNDAGKLVRVRRFTDNAESCMTSFDEDTPSRDTQYTYDWRGRPVITKEVVVDGAGHDCGNPALLSTTATVFDNLNRPVIVATWPPGGTFPTLDEIEAWAKLAPETAANEVCARTNQQSPQTVSLTLYDERGRVYEQRTYDPSRKTDDDYTFTKTYRDDLDRVTASLTPNGITVNTYDSLGRVTETSFCSEEGSTKGTCGGTELTRTKRTYDAFGNVLSETHFDRKHDTTGGIATTGNAVITYTYNWYHPYTKRLIATANYGTGAADGYTTNTVAPLDYNAGAPPEWVVSEYKIGQTPVSPDTAIITLYDYDAAGRRDYVRDPKGIVTKTWFDLLGRTLLVAENWDPDDGFPYEGPVRYKAYHYTRGGLQDMIVAIVPEDPTEYLDIDPTSITWTEDADNDFAGTGVSVTDATVQATRFIYNATLVNGSDSDHSDVVSHAPSLVGAIQYPATATSGGEAGQPSASDMLQFRYTVDGRVAQRTDQRNIKLDFHYGSWPTAPHDPTTPPFDQLTEVNITYPPPLPSPMDETLDTTVGVLAFDYTPRGQISTATAYSASTPAEALSEITYGYDGFGNLTDETLDPRPDVTPLFAKTVTYGWQWYQESAGKPKQNRLTDITYPSGRGFTFDYTRDGQTWTNAIGRMTGMSEVGGTNNPLIAYTTTGGGRNVKKVWGDDNDVILDYTTPNALDRFGRVAAMTFTSSNNPGVPLHMYEYKHDANGNRTSAFILQAGDISGYNWQRSYIYGYDNLNRLVFAECGEHALEGKIADGGTGQAWNLDVLGNWSGGSSNDSFISYTVGSLAGNDPGYDFGTDTWIEKRHDTTDEANRINTLRTEANGEPVENDDFYYDAAGNLVLDDEKFYKYDAWNRVVEVHDKGDYHVDAAGDLAGTDLGDLIATYDYDVLGRMIHKTVSGSGDLNTTGDGDYFYYDGHRLLEHHKHNGTSLALHRQYVYGLDYIDEVVAYYDSDETPTDPHFILQDANYNVVATTDHDGHLEQQYNYKPYGERLAAERIESDGTITDILGTPSLIATTKGHQGLDHMPEIDAVNNRTRILKPKLGRFMQEDPNETSLVLVDVMLTNAQNAFASAAMSAGGQHIDGPNLYQYLGSNPVNRRDPAGLYGDNAYEGPEAWDLAMQIPGDNFAAYAYATQTLNIGIDVVKGFALMALSFTPAGMVIDAMDAYQTLRKNPGDWDFWDVASIGGTALSAAVPFGKLVTSAFKYVRKGIKTGKGRQLAKVAARGVCFLAGTLVVTPEGRTAIESLRVGDRVLTTDQGLPSEPEPAPGTWRQVTLKMVNPESEGDILDIEVLRPLAWVESVRATEGATILFGLPEMGLKGPATVVSVSDCPAIKPPPGRVVLGTVSHLNGYVYELRFDGHDEPLYPTRRHRLFSVDRDSWVQTGDLRIGEKLKTIGGNATIRSVRKYPGVHRVHNLDIQTDDCYYVGHVEALSHNTNPCARGAAAGGVWTKASEGMSAQARAYQKQITGRTGQAFTVNGVKFDGVTEAGVLIDAKGPGYANFVRNGRFQSWFAGEGEILQQARRQTQAAAGGPILWHVAEGEAASAITDLFAREGVIGIIVIHTPVAP